MIKSVARVPKIDFINGEDASVYETVASNSNKKTFFWMFIPNIFNINLKLFNVLVHLNLYAISYSAKKISGQLDRFHIEIVQNLVQDILLK